MAYRGPGVYTKEIKNPTFLTLPGGARVLAIVGEAPNTIEIADIEIKRGSVATLANVAVDVVAEDTQNDVAGKIQVAVNALADFGASVVDNVVTVTAASFGVWGNTLIDTSALVSAIKAVQAAPDAVISVALTEKGDSDTYAVQTITVTMTTLAIGEEPEAANVVVPTSESNHADVIPNVLEDGSDVVDVVRVGNFPGLNNYTEVTDWEQIENKIDWSSASNEPEIGANYYITIVKTKGDDYYEPFVCYSQDEARALYGSEYQDGVLSQLSLASSIGFRNGASVIVTVQSKSSAVADIQDAIDKLESENIYALTLAGVTDEAALLYAVEHIDKMSSVLQRKERITFIPPKSGITSIADLRNFFKAVKNERATVVVPPQVQVDVSDATTRVAEVKTLDSSYAAVALAGLICNPIYDAAESTTRKTLIGIRGLVTGIPGTSKYLENQMNLLAEDGGCVLIDKGGLVKVRHGITSDPTNANTSEISIRVIRDEIVFESRELLDERFVGAKRTPTTLSNMNSVLNIYLSKKIEQGIINEFTNISVIPDEVDPRRVDVRFNALAVYPLIWIDVQYSLI